MSAFYERCRASREARRASGESGTGETPAQEESEGEEPDIVRMAVRFDRREYPPQITPKMFLLEWCRKERLLQPGYQTVQRPLDRFFRSVVTVDEKRYRSTLW
ncbi:hypothetical protein FKM82_025992 [Ascaphus truei]